MTAPIQPQQPQQHFSPDMTDEQMQGLIDSLQQTPTATDGTDGGDPLSTLAPGQRPIAGQDPSHMDVQAPQAPQAPMSQHDAGLGHDDALDEAAAPTDPLQGGDQLQVDPSLVPEPVEEQPEMSPDEERELRQAAAALYGSDFPLLKTNGATSSDWVNWAQSTWDRHRSGMQKILHTVERNRRFRADDQWLAHDNNGGPWRTLPKPKDTTRVVDNVITPALDLRVQIVREQMPGFRTRPTSQDVDAQKKAEAQQMALEYSYTEQDMPSVLAEAAYWAGTDGVCFIGPYWHPDEGPWAEQGGAQKPQGDIRTCVYRIEQVRVSANATATRKPYYWIVRETIPTSEAVAQHGVAVVDGMGSSSSELNDLSSSLMMDRLGTPSIHELYRDQETVNRYTIYCERSEFLPQGMTLMVVGDAVAVQPAPLLYGVVPLVRMTDGSTDPAFYPTPIMNQWVPHQIRINALKSKWIDSVRVNATGRFIAKKGSLVTETLIGSGTSVLEVQGPFTNPADALVPVNGFSIGSDTKELLDRERTLFEQKSGWNDASRGSFDSDQSGRAILAVREQLERIFAPPVQAAAKAMGQWGKINLHIFSKMLSAPRAIAITGTSRSDLAREITAEDFNGVSEVEVDPETLMPMPRSLRLYLLEQLFQAGVIDAQEYRRRLPFAFTGSLETPDDVQSARAKRVCDAIRQGQPIPPPPDPMNPATMNAAFSPLGVRWTDNEAIHQDTLEREILTRDDLDPQVISVAMQRWTALAQQSAMKSGGMPMGGGPGGPPQNPPGPQPGMDPREQPTFGSNPSIAAAPQSMQHPSDQMQAAAGFESAQPQ